MKINKIVCDVCQHDIEKDETYYTLDKVAPPKTPSEVVSSTISSISLTTRPERTALDVCEGCVQWLKRNAHQRLLVQEA